MSAQVGDRVRFRGRAYTVLTVADPNYILVDETRVPMVDENGRRRGAHVSVRQSDVEPVVDRHGNTTTGAVY